MTKPYKSPALIISECQTGILEPQNKALGELSAQVHQRDLVAHTAALANEFRRRSLPVVHCIVEHRADQRGLVPNSFLATMAIKNRMLIAGSAEAMIPAALGPDPADLISSRATGLTAFYGTNLDAMLRLQGIETLVLSGVSTTIALPGLALEAVNRGYHVVLAEDCSAGTSAEHHEFMVDNVLAVVARIESSATIIERLPELPD